MDRVYLDRIPKTEMMERLVQLSAGASFDLESLDDSKAGMLSRSTRYDRCCYRRGDGGSFVYNAKAPNGRCVRLFRTLFTNECFHQCGYCPNAGRLSGGCSYTSEELVNFTLKLKDAGLIDGLFLSSGAGKDVDLTMEGMLSSVRLLREKHGFSGYIHLKIIPGTSRDLIKEAVRLADRVSLNIEAPSRDIMEELSSTKDYENDILKVQKYIRDISMRANQTTQMVVGAADESDMEIFKRAVMEYDEIGVKRVYYSAFVPRKGTRFEMRPPQMRWRERRLYQLDWLYRVYGFAEEELKNVFDDAGFLPDRDPKIAVARAFLDEPLDVNEADLQSLLRVPGIGPESAARLVAYRRKKKIKSSSDLIRLGVRRKAIPYLKINGWVQKRLL